MDDQVLMQLVHAVDAILDPNTSPAERMTAHSICESCKENEMSCLIGYALVLKYDVPPHVRHFGLQLMQQFVRNKWTKAPQETQIQTKNNAMDLIKSCRIDESCYIKDGTAHVLAEIIKHVWPQQWPSMVHDLLAIAKQGPIQTELVDLVFLRVAEDVAVLQNISASHRSQDIRQGLSLSMGELIGFFTNVLEENTTKYAQLIGTTNEAEISELKVYGTLSSSTLRTLQGFVEWAGIEHIFARGGALIHVLSKLLEIEGLRVLAAECLTLIVHRKGQPTDRKHILVLTTPSYVDVMLSAIKKSFSSPVSSEEQYLFMKRMGGLLSSMAGQVVSAWLTEKESVESEGTICSLASHTAFLNLLLEFLKQDNPVLSDTVSSSWHQMLQHQGMLKDPTLISYVPQLLRITATRVQKGCVHNLPAHAQLDFNDAEEVELFLSIHRRTLLQVVRGCACALPNECMCEVMNWVKTELRSPIDAGTDGNGVKLEQCSCKSPSYIRWDALKNVLEMTIKTGILHAKKQQTLENAPIAAAERLLDDLLCHETTDVLLYQCLVSFIGAFLPTLETLVHRKEFLTGIIQKYTGAIKFSLTHPNCYGSAVAQLRRHGLSALVHICKYYPGLIMTIYSEFKDAMGEIVTMLSNLEKVCVCESMVLVSGEWNDFSSQSDLIKEMMSFTGGKWFSNDEAGSPRELAAAMGLLSPGSEYKNERFSTFRNNISFCVAQTMGMVNRSRVPEDPELLRKGGFLDDDGNVKHPCMPPVLDVLQRIANLVEFFHSLWTAEIAAVIHKDYLKSLNMRESERRSMISFNPVTKVENNSEKQPWEKMQTFILIVLENCYQILGTVGKCCSLYLYADKKLLSSLLQKAFSNIDTLPQLRIRSFTRQFLYYFLKSCPEPCYHSVAAPVMQKYCQYMNQTLQVQWNDYANKEQARLKVIDSWPDRTQDCEDAKEDEEILKEQLLRTVSREYLEMLVNLCVNKRPHPKNGGKEEDENNDAEMQDSSAQTQSLPNSSQLTPLGSTLVQTEIAEILLATALVSLSWHDTPTAFKGVQLAWPLLKRTFATTPCINSDAAKFMFESTLLGLQRQGQHDGCSAQLVALSLYIFVTLRPTHDALVATLKTIPNVNRKDLENFDAGYLKYSEKKRKTNFKKLVSGVIEQHIGQRFKTQQHMRRLPKFFQGRKPKNLDIDVEKLGLEVFFKPES